MTAVEVAARLHAHAAGQGRWRARCPSHRGKSTTSLSIAQGERGVLLRCWGGCTFDQVIEAVGLRASDLFSSPRQRRPEDELDPSVREDVGRAEGGFRRHPAAPRADHPLTVLITDEAHADQSIARALALATEGELVQITMEGTHGNRSC